MKDLTLKKDSLFLAFSRIIMAKTHCTEAEAAYRIQKLCELVEEESRSGKLSLEMER